MQFGIALRTLIVWGTILILAVLNGGLREAILIPNLGTVAGNIMSGVFLSAVILTVAYISLPFLSVDRPIKLMVIGLGWLVLTLLFEFSFGLWQGKSWQVMFEAYTFNNGNIWPIVLMVTALAPYLATKLRELMYSNPK